MNINQFAHIKNCDYDEIIFKKLTYKEKMERIVNLLGYKEVKRCMPFDLNEIKDMYDKDQNMNFEMRKWRLASGVWCETEGSYLKPTIHWTPLVQLYRENKITVFSQSDGVSILKECARMWLEKMGLLSNERIEKC